MLNTLIIDDEWHARLSLRGLLESHFPDINIVAEAKDVPQGVQLINEHNPDLVFLDVEMPNYSGLELFKFLNTDLLKFKVIFVTAYNEYAVNAFELAAVDYILKPARKESLERAIEKVKNYVLANPNKKTTPQEIQTLQENIQFSNTQEQKIALTTGEGTIMVQMKDILYLKADGSYTHFILSNNQKILVSKRIAEYEKLETLGDFLRVHRSYIVNLHHIHKITKQDSIILMNGDEFSISEEKKKILNLWIKSKKI